MEALLRPPVELWSTCTAFAAGTLAWLAPWALMMPPGIAMATSLTFFGFGSSMACVALPASHEAAAGLPSAGQPDPRQSP